MINLKDIIKKNLLTESQQYVNPRDFFNLGNLFKTYGFLSLALLDGHFPLVSIVDNTDTGYQYGYNGYGYTIENYQLYLNEQPIMLYTIVNSKAKNPMYAMYDDEDYEVLTASGSLTDKFKELLLNGTNKD